MCCSSTELSSISKDNNIIVVGVITWLKRCPLSELNNISKDNNVIVIGIITLLIVGKT